MPAVLQAMTPRGRIVLGASVAAILMVAYLFFSIVSKPSYSTLQSGVNPVQTQRLAAALDKAGVKYELQNNGTSIAVQQGDMARARIAMSTAGLGAAGAQQPGFELMDKQKLGSSTFQQQITYQRALEGQIAQTIQQINGVDSAQVQLTMPQQQLFADEQKPATAAVLLGSSADGLDPATVRGIANLVASSVPNLKTANVTITDSSGQLVWPVGGADGSGSASLSKPAAEARYNAGLEASLNGMLARTLGPGKAEVQVSADLNVDQTTQEQLQYAKNAIPLHSVKDNESLKGAGGAAGAGAGSAANIPTYATTGAAAGGGKSNYKHSKSETDFGVDKTITHRKVAPGAVNRMSVSLLVDKTAVPTPAALASIKQAVASAAGINATRGDTITATQVAFAKVPAAKPAGGALPAGGIMGIAKIAGLGLASLLFLFFASRQLRKRETDVLAHPVWLSEIETPQPLSALSTGSAAPPVAPDYRPDDRRAVVEQVVERDPDRVAAQLRTWLNEDAQK